MLFLVSLLEVVWADVLEMVHDALRTRIAALLLVAILRFACRRIDAPDIINIFSLRLDGWVFLCSSSVRICASFRHSADNADGSSGDW